jgi:hypothetical protein
MTWISVTSSGPAVTATDYWFSVQADMGHLYLSSWHETLRILVPPKAEHVLAGLPPVGTAVELRRGTRDAYASAADLRQGTRTAYETYRLTWLVAPPHIVEIDLRLSDRRWPSDEDGTVAKLIWYSPVDGDMYGVRERRREVIQIGDVIAS